MFLSFFFQHLIYEVAWSIVTKFWHVFDGDPTQIDKTGSKHWGSRSPKIWWPKMGQIFVNFATRWWVSPERNKISSNEKRRCNSFYCVCTPNLLNIGPKVARDGGGSRFIIIISRLTPLSVYFKGHLLVQLEELEHRMISVTRRILYKTPRTDFAS